MTIRRSYIDAAHVAGARPRFVWDEWSVEDTYTPVEQGTVERLEKLCKRANCAFTIAIAEWILARFAGLDDDPEPAQFIEAAWAANVDLRYAQEMVIDDDEWSGPVRGPISMGLTFVIDALFAEEAGAQSAMNPAWAACFARHILPDSSAFDVWFEAVLGRLETCYPALADEDQDWFDVAGNWGSPPPPEAFDPAFPFDPATAGRLVDACLQRLDPAANPFLRTPAEMLADDFPGQPYRYAGP